MPLSIAFIDHTKAILSAQTTCLRFSKRSAVHQDCTEHDRILPLKHEGHSAVQQLFRVIRHPQWCQTGCVLASTLFGIFFALLLKRAFDTTTEGIYQHARSDGKMFNPARLRAKASVRGTLVRDMLFADDAAVATHTQQELQSLTDRFSEPEEHERPGTEL